MSSIVHVQLRLGGSLAALALSVAMAPAFAQGQAPAEDAATALSPQEEMQYAQLWHAIVGFVLMAVIIGHIYIGTLGMEGAYDAMGSGQVDENWAEQHHSLWLDKVKEREAGPETPAQPAE